MRGTRRVTKDGVLVGQNRGEVEDKRVEKLAELERYRRDNGMGQIRSQVDGFAEVTWECTTCKARHTAPKQHAGGLTKAWCETCGDETEHERVYPR